MSQVALHKRFTEQAVSFLQEAFKVVLQERISEECPIEIKDLSGFHEVILFDSTGWVLPADLKEAYPGCGGNRSQAGCKAQVCYNFTRGEITFFNVSSGIESDQKYGTTISGLLSEGDLVLIDQGYFSIKTLGGIAQKGAYFLTRYFMGTALYHSLSGKRVFLHKKLKYFAGKQYCAEVLVGKTNPVPARLICMRVDQKTAEQRRRKIRKDSKRKGRTPSVQNLEMCGWTVVITNASKEKLPDHKTYDFYRLRWQIELLFKQLKSVLRINQCATTNVNRLRCEIYGRMILAVLVHRLHAKMTATYWNRYRVEVSMEKIYKRIRERCFILLHYILISPKCILSYLLAELPLLFRPCLKFHQKSRKTTLQRIQEA